MKDAKAFVAKIMGTNIYKLKRIYFNYCKKRNCLQGFIDQIINAT